MKLLIRFLAITIILSGIVSCDKDDDPVPDPNVTFLATLNGAS